MPSRPARTPRTAPLRRSQRACWRRLAVATALATLLAAGSALASPGAAATSPPPARGTAPQQHGLGWRPLPVRIPVPALAALPAPGTPAPRALPASVDLSRWDVPVGDQGPSSACVPWTVAYAMMGWYARRQGHPGQPFAPMYVYAQVQLRDGFLDDGSYPFDAYVIAQQQGVPRLTDYQPQGNTDWRTQPTPLQRTKARANRTTGARFLYASWPKGPGPGARRLISAALANGHPVALSFAAFPSFMTLRGRGASFRLADAKGRSLGGHEVLVVGYDSFGVRIQNSWGTHWGDAGYARLSWDFVAAYSFDASVMDGFAHR